MALKSTSRPWSLRRKLLLGGIALTIALGLGLGLGLGLTIGRGDDDDNGDDSDNGNGPSPTITASPLATPTGTLRWTPKVNDTWQIILLNNIELDDDAKSVTPNVSVYDIDLFDTPSETIDTLHKLGKKVICYFSGGSFEPGRPDSDQFKDEDMGKELDGWPGEKWLKLDSANVRNIMKTRVQLAAKKGCDGVDPDNVDGYQNDNGISLTPDDSISFMSYLSSLTQPLNLTMGLKNAGDIIPYVLPVVHFSVNEQCAENNECDTFHDFIDADKPVFHIEYPDGAGSSKGVKKDKVTYFCDSKGSEGFSTVLKNMDLDGWVEYCDEKIMTTAINQTDTSH